MEYLVFTIKLKKILLSIALSFSILYTGYFILNTPKAHAQTLESLTITPPTIQLSVNPGDKKEGTLALTNDSDTPLYFVASVYDFIVQDKNGTPEVLPRDTISNNKYSAANWIAVYPDSFTVNPHQRFNLNYYVQVPANAGPGGHYSAIVYQPVNPNGATGSGASIKAQIATLVYLAVSGPIKEKAEVTSFTAPSFSEYGPVNITTEIKNLGDLHIAPVGNIKVYDIFGRNVYTSALTTRNIFPGNVALDYMNTIGKHLMFGRFKAEFLASYGVNNNLPLMATVVFWVIPWRLILVIFFILLALILLTLFMLKRKNSGDNSQADTQTINSQTTSTPTNSEVK